MPNTATAPTRWQRAKERLNAGALWLGLMASLLGLGLGNLLAKEVVTPLGALFTEHPEAFSDPRTYLVVMPAVGVVWLAWMGFPMMVRIYWHLLSKQNLVTRS